MSKRTHNRPRINREDVPIPQSTSVGSSIRIGVDYGKGPCPCQVVRNHKRKGGVSLHDGSCRHSTLYDDCAPAYWVTALYANPAKLARWKAPPAPPAPPAWLLESPFGQRVLAEFAELTGEVPTDGQ